MADIPHSNLGNPMPRLSISGKFKFWHWEVRDKDPEVLFVTNMYPHGSSPTYGIFVKRQIESLRRQGLRCDVLHIKGYLGSHSYILSAAWFLVATVAWRNRYRLVHAHAGETGMIVRFMLGVPVLTSYCGDDLQGHFREDGTISLAQRFRRWVIRQHTRACSMTITKSPEMHNLIPRKARHRNRVLPNGVDTSEFKPRARDSARSELGWEGDGPVVLFAATRPYEPRKRLDLAREAVKVAESSVGPIWLHVAENVAPSLVPIMMNASDCLLLTSRMEGSPNVVKEALMSNLPVVSTSVGDVDELLAAVQQSFVCSDHPAELGEALARVLASRQRSNGRTVKAHLSDVAIADRLLAIYDELCPTAPITGS